MTIEGRAGATTIIVTDLPTQVIIPALSRVTLTVGENTQADIDASQVLAQNFLVGNLSLYLDGVQVDRFPPIGALDPAVPSVVDVVAVGAAIVVADLPVPVTAFAGVRTRLTDNGNTLADVNASQILASNFVALKALLYLDGVLVVSFPPMSTVQRFATPAPAPTPFEASGTDLVSVSGEAITLGQKDAARSLPVVLPTDRVISTTGVDKVAIGDIETTQAVFVDTQASGACGVNISGTWTGTVNFQATVDGLTWDAIAAVTPDTGAEVTSATANGTWVIACAGFLAVRVIGNAVATGTAVVSLRASVADAVVGTAIISGSVTVLQGTTPWVDNITQIGGSAITLGQKAMAASVPVVIASDQSALPVTFSGTHDVNLTQVGGVAITLGQKAMAASAPVVIASDQSAVPVSGTVAVTQSTSPWVVSGTVTSNQGTPAVVGNAWPTKISDGVDTVGISTVGGAKALKVDVIQSVGGSGGTSSSFGAAFPAAGTAAGFSDGTNMQGARVFDADTGAGTQYVAGAILRKSASGGSVEAGTSTDPLRVDPTGTTTQPISAVSLPLPTGAATEATLATRVADATITARLGVLGQAVMAASAPVVIASNQSAVPISAAALPLPAGAATEATLATRVADATITARLGVLGQAVMAASAPVVIASNQSAVPVSSTQLPAALVGARLDTNIGAWLGSTAPTVGQKAMAASVPVVMASNQTSFPVTVSGSVAVDQNTTPWTIAGVVDQGEPNGDVRKAWGVWLQDVNSSNFSTITGAGALVVDGSAVVQPVSQTGAWLVVGGLTNNNLVPSGDNLGVLPAIANAAAPTWTEGKQVLLSSDLTGKLRVSATLVAGGTVAVTQSTSPWVVSGTVTVVQPTGTNLHAVIDTGSTTAVTQATASNLNAQVQGAGASGAAKAGNPVQIGGVFNTTQPTVTTGQTVESQMTARGAQIVATGVDAFTVQGGKTNNGAVPGATNVGVLNAVATAAAPVYAEGKQVSASTNLSGALRVVAEPASQPTYSATAFDVLSAALATDVFTITGSATKTVKVTRFIFSSTQTTASVITLLLLKRSTANTGGTSTVSTNVPHDSADAAGTATVRSYTANPTTGTLVGVIRADKIRVPLAAGTVAGTAPQVYDFGQLGKSIVLSGTSEMLAFNFNGVTVTGGSFDFTVEWNEF